MTKPLVIVESPAKARTIGKFLGAGYEVRASMGHVRDLPRSGLCVYPDRDFEADWEPIADRAKVIGELKRLAAKADTIYLATDPDREGEAIAWHLLELLIGAKQANETLDRVRRVHFHEITKPAIEAAFSHPGKLDEHLVDSYLARRLLDRLVGYQLSELLWKKLTRGLSAGRVQSVAVKLVVEREREIRKFVPEEYWRLVARFGGPAADLADGTEDEGAPPVGFTAEFKRLDGKARPLARAGDVAAVLARTAKIQGTPWELVGTKNDTENPDALSGRELVPSGPFRVAALKQSPKREAAKPPFKTSTLQQAASGRYGFSPQRTMRVAQQLYEGIELPGEGAVGLITYMRTDSFNVAAPAQAAALELIRGRWGDRFVPEKPNRYRSGGGAQEAHEAIRPTDPSRSPDQVRRALTEEQWKLYDLVWRRFLASQMTPAEHLVTTLELERGGAVFTAGGRVTTFAGWTAVYGGDTRKEPSLPEVREGQELEADALAPSRHFTKPPKRYTEASLVKALEEHGIGRPSTYASIIATIVDRKYVDHGEESEQEKLRFALAAEAAGARQAEEDDEPPPDPTVEGAAEEDEEALVGGRRRKGSSLHATHLGEVVTDLLEPSFADVIDTRFTARFEDDLDHIAEGQKRWQDVVRGFYDRFVADLEAARDGMQHYRSHPLQVSDITCDKVDEKTGKTCGAPMVVLFNRGGAYLGCSRYPECSNNLPLSGVRSSTGELTEHTCHAKDEKTGAVCGRPMELKTNRWGRKFLACTGYKSGECKGAVSVSTKGEPLWPVETTVPCPTCGRILVVKRSRRGKFLACPGYPKCRATMNLPSCPHESRGGKVCGATMTEPAADGLMACREHPDSRLAPLPSRTNRAAAKGGAEAAGDEAEDAAKPKKASRKLPAKSAEKATKTPARKAPGKAAKKPARKKPAGKGSPTPPA